MATIIEKIDVVRIEDFSEIAQKEIHAKVAAKPTTFQNNFKGFVEIRMASASPVKVQSYEPIEGTDVEWFKKMNERSGIDFSNIF